MISRNTWRGDSDETAGAARSGTGLLAGLLRCRRCGRKLHVRYWGKAGTSARYLCPGDFITGGGRYCLGFGGATVDRRVGAEGATPQKVTKLLFHEAGEALPIAEVSRLRQKRLEVIAHHLMQNGRCRLPRLVGRRRGGHARSSAEPVPRSATPETVGCLDDQAHDNAVSEPATGPKGGSFLEAPVDCVRRIGTDSSSLRRCEAPAGTMRVGTRNWGQLWGQLSIVNRIVRVESKVYA